MRTKSTIIRNKLENIEHIHEHWKAVQAARELVDNPYQSSGIGNDLLNELVKRELDEWRSMFTFALVAEPKELKRIRAAAYERFLSDKMSVSHWFGENGSPATFWLDADEKQFRAMCKKLFSPKSND